jgi:hypothetical protein
VKLRKQAPAKAIIIAATAGLLFAFLSLIRSEPRLKAEAEPLPPLPDFDRFFVPRPADSPAEPPAVSPPRPHTRTRAS